MNISRKIGNAVFFVEFDGNAICLICEENLVVLKKYNLKRHCATKHGRNYEKNRGDNREKKVMGLVINRQSRKAIHTGAVSEGLHVVKNVMKKKKSLFNNIPSKHCVRVDLKTQHFWKYLWVFCLFRCLFLLKYYSGAPMR